MAIGRKLNQTFRKFIERQKLFFVATAAGDGRVNVSPKGMDTLRVVDGNRIVWLNLTGSGNETAAHVSETWRMTLMFCSFERQPLIMRLYGSATATHVDEPGWGALYARFRPQPGARQVFDLAIESVQTSCGFAVPRYSFVGERDTLGRWAENRGEAGIRAYWNERNARSIDGKPTGMPAERTDERRRPDG